VDTKFQQKFVSGLTARPTASSCLCPLYAPGVHAGLETSENKFKCLATVVDMTVKHQIRRTAPRPMDRAHIDSRPTVRFWWTLRSSYLLAQGQPSKFHDPGAF